MIGFLLTVGLVLAQVETDHCWGPRSVPGRGVRVVQPEWFSWEPAPGWKGGHYLKRNGVYVGGWNEETKVYRSWTPETLWGETTRPPIAPPLIAPPSPIEGKGLNYGVENFARPPEDRATLGGQPISIEQAFDLAAGGIKGSVPDDTNKPHLTVIVNTDKRRAEIEQALFGPKGQELRERYRIQVYDVGRGVDAVMVEPFATNADDAFKEQGVVTHIQQPSNGLQAKMLGSFYGWSSLEAFEEAVRRADPDWRPSSGGLKNRAMDAIIEQILWGVLKATLYAFGTLFLLMLAVKGAGMLLERLLKR